ncbi:MAG: 4Fe-4S dicluster domain-containing protein [Candidatus Delongbacteria bacterium]|nr:4Fe-4S dicluster domain-containing protein [Candidatus Delongbacteria bacterium]
MSKLLTIDKNRDTVVKDLLKHLLEKEVVSGVFTLRKIHDSGSHDYAFTTKIENLDIIDPFYPIMPLQAGQVLSGFTPMDKPVAVVIRPCEFRAYVEMVKRAQGSMDNFLFITHTCGGVIPLKDNVRGKATDQLEDYWKATENGEIHNGVRTNCKACEHFAPTNADILISVINEEANTTKLYLNTDKAVKFTEGFEGKLSDNKFDASILDRLAEKRLKEKEALFASVDKSDKGLDGMVEIFGKCIGCRGCNSVCPICYCTQCDFSSSNFDYNTGIMEKELEQKGALRLPPDTIFFHLGRLSHMAYSCVGCGQCTDVCPSSIPVGPVFKRSGEHIAKVFDFVPGRDVNEQIPVMIFKEQEFPEMGE